ncbi:energy transducer TonB [Niabella insulamsoli]|uniref:energy transducer TonB n=1 Tax=Niabella insulamsoli TaxID=3144874 RepID=UPI0031FBF7AD
METAKILEADFLDIVFDGRNKSYGAYELRTHYQHRLIKAMLITVGIFMAIAGGAWLKNSLAKANDSDKVRIYEDLEIANIKPLEEKLPPPPPPPPPVKIEAPKIKTTDFTTPIVTKEMVVDPPPTQDELMVSKISNITQDGISNVDIVVPPEDRDGEKGLITSVKKEASKLPFTSVEIEASYIGDWKKFLERNLSGQVAVDNGAAPGLYTVVIQFVVDINGTVSDIKALTNKGFGMEEEAIRVIKKSGKWKPAFQNKGEVKAYRKQPITFQVTDQ